MKRALVLSLSDLTHDARVSRQVGFLASDFEVTLAAFGPGKASHHRFHRLNKPALDLVRRIRIAFLSLSGRYEKAWQTLHSYREAESSLSQESWDLIMANDAETLPMAFRIKGSSDARVVFDAHEYAPRHFEDRPIWKLIFQPVNKWICTAFIHRTSAMFTVGKGLAQAYAENFPCHPVIITNAPAYKELPANPPSGKQVRLVHHGIANPSRRLELLYETMLHLDERFTLDLYLVTSDHASASTQTYIRNLLRRFGNHPAITVHPPVPGHELVDVLHQYDAGIFLLPPQNFNYANAMPNKLFDFIQARLAVMVGPSPEMAEVVRQFDLGIVSDSFEPAELAGRMNQLTPEKLLQYKRNSAAAAKACCAENNEVLFRETISRAIRNP